MTTSIIMNVIVFIEIVLGIFVFNCDKKSQENVIFMILCLFGSLWTITNNLNYLFRSDELLSSTYAFGALVMFTGITWVCFFCNIKKYKKTTFTVIHALVCITLIFFSFQDDFLASLRNQMYSDGAEHYNILFLIYLMYFLYGSTLMIYFLLKRYIKSKDEYSKKQSLLIIVGIASSTIVTFINSFVLPLFHFYPSGLVDNIGFIIFIFSIFIAIIRFNLFEIKIFYFQIMVLALWIAIFTKAISADSLYEITSNSLVLVFAIIICVLLINYFFKEKEFKDTNIRLIEHLTTLNNTLSEKVIEQTSEIRKVYEIEQKARKDLEKLNETKDQFILLTQHNLRSPINSIRHELTELIDGRIGTVDNKARDVLISSNKSANRLSDIVDDFLNISTIKIDSQILKLTYGNIKTIINDVVHELRLDINRLNLNIQYISSNEIWPEIKMDMNKIREAIQIVVENAVKYNIYSGSVVINNSIDSNQIKLTVKNTGMGITSNEKNNLFKKLFYRSDRAKEINPIGMGIGLQVARAIISGHHGKLIIDSSGENLGACVTISLPLDTATVIERKFY